MRFAAGSNSNNFISAGVNAARAGVDAHDAARASSPRYEKFGIQALRHDAEAFSQRQKNLSRAVQSGISATTNIKRTEIEVDKQKSIAKSKSQARKAGAIAAGAVGIAKSMKPVKDEKLVEGAYPDLTSRIKAARDKVTSIKTEREKLYGTPGNTDTKPGSTDTKDDTPSPTPSQPVSGGKISNPSGIEQTPGWSKLSRVIRHAEGTSGDKGYTTMFGHRQFTDTSRHPNSPMATPWGTQSEAAGAYQFMKPTWDGVVKATGVKDFSPQSQEIGGRWLTSNRGVNPDAVFTTKEELGAALHKLSPEWASLPNSSGRSHYDQPVKSLDELWKIYQGQ